MSKALRLAVCGAGGRMGSQVAALAAADPRFSLAARIVRGLRLSDYLGKCDAVVDFTSPASSIAFAAAAAKARKPLVVGTTGFTPPQRRALARHARKTAILLAPNFSLGVAVLEKLAAQAAQLLPRYDAGVWEVHHKAKRDAPSGTALRLAHVVGQARGGAAVAAVSQRLGDVIGEHTVTFAGPFERIELTHRAHSRALFARGALEAALWLRGRKAGLYGMPDLIDRR